MVRERERRWSLSRYNAHWPSPGCGLTLPIVTSQLPVTGPIASQLPQLRRSLKWYEPSELEAGYESQHYECVGSGIDQIITTLSIVTLDTWSGRTYIFPLTDSGLHWHAAARDSLLGPRRRERSHSPGVTTAQLGTGY